MRNGPKREPRSDNPKRTVARHNKSSATFRFRSQYRLPTSIDEAEHLATTFLTINGWTVHAQRYRHEVLLTAKKAHTDWSSFVPERTTWRLQAHNTTSTPNTVRPGTRETHRRYPARGLLAPHRRSTFAPRPNITPAPSRPSFSVC